jgi:hypothetical protein
MAIRPSDRRRLARLAGPRVWAKREEVERRVKLRDQIGFCVLVGTLLTIEGVDPETTCIPARVGEAQAELAAIPDTPELEQADEDYLAREDPGWVDDWQRKARYRPLPREEKTPESEIERLMGRYRTDCKDVDLSTRSSFELYAWCLSRHGATYEEAAAECDKAAEDLLLRLDELPDDPTPEDIERVLLAEEKQ